MDEEGRDVGIVPDDHHIFIGGALVKEALKLREGGAGGEGFGDEDGGLITGLGADELRGLEAALEWAGDDEVEVDVKRVEDVGELEGVTLTLFVERTFDINHRIGAASSGTGVAKKIQIHAWSFSGSVGV
jgi:hypothetical protein